MMKFFCGNSHLEQRESFFMYNPRTTFYETTNFLKSLNYLNLILQGILHAYLGITLSNVGLSHMCLDEMTFFGKQNVYYPLWTQT